MTKTRSSQEVMHRFERLERMLSNDEKMFLVILNEMEGLVNEYRIQSIVYILKKLFSFPLSYKFHLNASPFSRELSRAFFRLKFVSFLGKKLINTHPLASDYQTGLIKDCLYELTPFSKKFVTHLSSKDENCKRWRDTVRKFAQKMADNGYTDHIDKYASWVYLEKDLAKKESKSVLRYYMAQHDVKKKEIRAFFEVIEGP